MRKLHISLLLTLLYAITAGITTNSLFAESGLNKYDAIIVGHHVRMREKPNTKAKTIGKINTGLLVKILEQTKILEKLTKGNSCDDYGYNWYKIETTVKKKSKTGWVFGKFLFKISNKSKGDSITHKEYTINKKKYLFAVAHDTSFGPSAEDGPTGCDATYVPFFHRKGANSVLTIKYDDKKFKAFDLGWKSKLFDGGFIILVSNSEGGADEITSITYAKRKKKYYLHMKIIFTYQDGGSTGDLYIGLLKGKLSVIAYKNKREN